MLSEIAPRREETTAARLNPPPMGLRSAYGPEIPRGFDQSRTLSDLNGPVLRPIRSNGIGSDAYAIVWDGKRLHGLNASGRSPAAWTLDYFKGRSAMPVRGWDTVTVPGCVQAWVELHASFGKLPFKKLSERASQYGREGYLVSLTIAGQWEKQMSELKDQPGFAKAFLPGGRAPRPGERFRFPEHAKVLERIAATKGKAFYRGELAEKIEAHARKHGGAGSPPKGGTVYLTAADASGMMVSYIQSNYMGFGSGVVVDGISIQNRGGTFVLKPGHPNCVGPGKRPYQTIIPGFVTNDRKPVMSFGVMGGTMQPQGHAQVMVRIADYGQSPQAACDGPRFRVVQGLDVSVEEGNFPAASLEELQRRGHRIVKIDDYNQFGSAQLIWKLDGGYFSASDPRRDGQAVGF